MFKIYGLVKILMILFCVIGLCAGLYLIATSPEIAIANPGIAVADVLEVDAGPLPVGLIFVLVGIVALFLTMNWKISGVEDGFLVTRSSNDETSHK
ncbi:MAG: hypothetical protein R3C30_11740 [Hyphomonadaceae bacterium]